MAGAITILPKYPDEIVTITLCLFSKFSVFHHFTCCINSRNDSCSAAPSGLNGAFAAG